jgi:DNA-binding HxlR family transcriptional regulator
MATALDVIGDRWALLIVRDLVLGARRFTELAASLPGIGTDILTARLRGLEDAGIVARHGSGRQQRYQLTARGHALRPVLAELGRWGAALLSPPASADQVAPRTGLTTLVLDPRQAPADLDGVFDIRCDGESARVDVHGHEIMLVPADGDPVDPASPAATVIDLTRPGLLGVLAGTAAPDLIARGDLTIRGDRAAGALLIATLASPRVLAALLQR